MENAGGVSYKEAMELADAVKKLPKPLKALVAKVGVLAIAGGEIEKIEQSEQVMA